MTALLWWLLVCGLWPFADPGHNISDGMLVWIDLGLHFGAGWALLDREIERRALARAADHAGGVQ